MSILIKDIEMSKKDSVMLWVLPNGIACVMDDSGRQYKVIEISTPHGKLIDADMLMKIAYDYIDDFGLEGLTNALNEMPTIIEAEE